MSHQITATHRGEVVLDVNVSGDLSGFYDFFSPSANQGTNGDGDFQTYAGLIATFLAETPDSPDSKSGISILRRELQAVIDDLMPCAVLVFTCF